MVYHGLPSYKMVDLSMAMLNNQRVDPIESLFNSGFNQVMEDPQVTIGFNHLLMV